jgi:hypothetical protein
MIKSRQKSRVVISSSSKKKTTTKVNDFLSSKISTKLLQTKIKGGISNYNLETISDYNMMSFKPSTFKTKESIINKKITEHEEYKYNMPPENLTYEKLQKLFSGDLQEIFSGDLQNDMNFYLEKNAEKIAEEIAEEIINIEGNKKKFLNYDINIVNNVFIEKIEKIEKYIENKELLNIKDKELLRKNLWNILYTSHYGYDSKYKEKYGDKFDEITIGQAIDDKINFDKTIIKKPKAKSFGGNYDKLIDNIVNGGGPRDHSPGNPLRPPLPPKLPRKFFIYFPSVIKYLWNILFEMLNNPSSKNIKNYSEELLDPPPRLIYNHLEIMDELPYIKIEIINSLTSSEDINKMKSEFNFVDYNVDNKFITRSIFLRRKIENEKNHASYIYSNYSIDEIDILFYKPFQDLYIYGMRNPNQYDRAKLLSIMFFLLEKLKITDFIDLQDCEGGTYQLSKNPYMNCNPYDRGIEREMFDLAAKVLHTVKDKKENKINRNYKNIKDIVDMTAGTIVSWNQINNLPVASSENRMIIHCYAGKGRTGTTLLFLRLRDIDDINIVSRLNKEHLGYSNIIDLINNLSELFNSKKSSQIHEEAENNLDINYWKEVKKEVFKIEQIWHVKLLRQRLNRIFYFLAKSYNVKVFYLYAIPFSEHRSFQQIYNFNYKDTSYQEMISFFSIQRQVNINWDKFELVKLRIHQNYIDGII